MNRDGRLSHEIIVEKPNLVGETCWRIKLIDLFGSRWQNLATYKCVVKSAVHFLVLTFSHFQFPATRTLSTGD